MTRPLRLHVEGGCYYARQNGAIARAVFAADAEFRAFEQILGAVAAQGGIELHAYCLLPDAIHLALTLRRGTLAQVMQRITGSYARHIQSRRNGHFFRHRYRALLLEPAQYLLPLVRYLHYLPVLLQLARSTADHTHSSDRIYRDLQSVPWVDCRRVHELLTAADVSYETLMAMPPSLADVEAFSGMTATILGSAAFRSTLPRRATPPRPAALTLEHLIRDVMQLLEVSERELVSRSRGHDAVLARSLIAWLAIERKLATLTQIARRFNRDTSTLSKAITRCQQRRPDLFRLDVLHTLRSLAPRDAK